MCSKSHARAIVRLTAQFPAVRVTPSKPFSRCGVDYVYLLRVLLSRGHRMRNLKDYITVSISPSTKAIYLELIGDVTTDCFRGALTRLTACRGSPSKMIMPHISMREIWSFANFSTMPSLTAVELEVCWPRKESGRDSYFPLLHTLGGNGRLELNRPSVIYDKSSDRGTSLMRSSQLTFHKLRWYQIIDRSCLLAWWLGCPYMSSLSHCRSFDLSSTP